MLAIYSIIGLWLLCICIAAIILWWLAEDQYYKMYMNQEVYNYVDYWEFKRAYRRYCLLWAPKFVYTFFKNAIKKVDHGNGKGNAGKDAGGKHTDGGK